MVCAIEDAGFEIRDQIGWVYGSGFPKSINLGEGRGSALKPAWEPICVARKPFKGTLTACVAEHGTGGLNIDACRVEGESTKRVNTAEMGYHGGNLPAEYRTGSDSGRWPANLIHDGSDEVLAVFPQAPGQLADVSSSETRKNQNVYGEMRRGRGDEPSADSDNNGAVGFKMKPGARRLDSGSAARFFYCAKASRSDRGNDNTHPTVKPTSLMRYLCRLVTPAGGMVLDPFVGSGSTGKAAVLEGFQFIGIERDPDYVALARARIDAVIAEMLI
jgi:site-specific DNA-methyltransferase (adenine-specific)